MSAPDLTCNYAKTHTLSAGVATDIDVPIHGASDWVVVIRNTGSTNALTAASYAVSPLGTYFEPSTSITTGIPLATNTSLAGLRGNGEPVETLRLTLTSTSGTTVAVEAAGK